ncbi:MAG: HigA family addiction module antidote protein [Proteobacteria bacterium]|nr:HigA family addiction module antidote protein [Pseudomonadota bacterium]
MDKINHWNIHPGEILKEEFLGPLGLTSYRLAKEIHVPAPRIHDIINQKRGITADTALRLSKFFCTTPQFWMNLQDSYEIRQALQAAGEDIDKISSYTLDSTFIRH